MRIVRLDVDEGFLDGLSVEFSPGLNVIIGARGVGKTSVIEILRFVLDASWFTSDAESRSRQQVKSVLGNGLARVTLLDGDQEVVVVRGGSDEKPRATGTIPDVMVLAQNEIEAVGAQERGRLSLVDRFRQDSKGEIERKNGVVAQLRSYSRECSSLVAAIGDITEQLSEFEDVAEKLEAAQAEQKNALESVKASQEQQEKLTQLQQKGARLAVERETLTTAATTVERVQQAIERAGAIAMELPDWPADAGEEDLLEKARGELHRASTSIEEASASVEAAGAAIQQVRRETEASQVRTSDRARELRIVLESLQEGLGDITARVDRLRERAAHASALRSRASEVRMQLQEASEERSEAFSTLERLRTERYEERDSIASWLTGELSPTIKVAVTKSASRGDYQEAVIEALRGSGIHYNRLAPDLVDMVSPLELVELAESMSVEAFAERAELTVDRAANVLTYLRSEDLSDVLTARIEDTANIWLLDGGKYKPAEELSIGQRCTAVLPILLRSKSEILVVDQPEDHLDNAFITGTLVSTLRNRSPDAQFIFASHNANIPVLGEADRIVHLDSDGRRGFPIHQGPLDHPLSVKGVTDVMEGGFEAFRKRAKFYASHSNG